MSHIVTIQTEVRDPAAIIASCERLQLPPPVLGTAKLFATQATGWQVQLPAWRYPLVCQTETGQLHYDNFQGRWGAQQQLDQFLQRYAVEKTRLEARRQGHTLSEQLLANGSIKLTIQLGDPA
ncbi:MAG: DUF1257 domain-containing protein [Planctomycetaceae bacterium]|nr:DUF1257 domain-containing protein [Planctomycetaceae bacterium]